MKKMNDFIKSKFGVDETAFLQILKTSHGAEGYLLGSLSEQLFKNYAESAGYEVLRIKEKPEGGYDAKSDEARGDFYIRKKGSKKDEWLVIECKSVKSNAEKRANLTEKASCLNFLEKHSIKRPDYIIQKYNSGLKMYESEKEKWNSTKNTKRYPTFKWSKDNPGPGIPNLTALWKTKKEIETWLNTYNDKDFSENAYWDLKAPIRLIQTHMPSSRTDKLGIKSTGPLNTDFNILCVDLFLRTGKHEFVFANSMQLNHQAKAPNHLQQNYTIDILVEKDGFKRHKLLPPWYDNLSDCIKNSSPSYRKIDKSQLDFR